METLTSSCWRKERKDCRQPWPPPESVENSRREKRRKGSPNVVNGHQVSHRDPSLNDTQAEEIQSSTETPERTELKHSHKPQGARLTANRQARQNIDIPQGMPQAQGLHNATLTISGMQAKITHRTKTREDVTRFQGRDTKRRTISK